MRLFTAIASVTALLNLACGGGSEGTQRQPFTGQNNTAILQGVALGAGTEEPALLRKALGVSVVNPSASLTTGRAFNLRSRSNTETAYLAVEVTNSGTLARCFIKATGLDLRDAAGETVKSDTLAFLKGSVGQLGTTRAPILTSTCLAPGESGWLMTIYPVTGSEQVFSRAESVIFTWDNDSSSSPKTPAPKLIPTAYELTADDALRVAFDNSGTGEASMSGHFSRYLLLDAEGAPLDWGFLNEKTSPAGGLVPAGTAGSVETGSTMRRYTGSASSVQPLLDFNLPEPGALSSQDPEGSGLEAEAARLAAWNALQDRQQREAGRGEPTPPARNYESNLGGPGHNRADAG